MKVNPVKITEEISIGSGKPPLIIAGPCAMESYEILCETFVELKKLSEKYHFNFIFKSSFDKANRTSYTSFRGPGIDIGLSWIEKMKNEFGEFDFLVDVHEISQIEAASKVATILQVPAFLCRQTDFIRAVSSSNLPINIKKGQFLSPDDVPHVVNKAKSTGNNKIFVTERGTTFGYNNLVVDFRTLPRIREQGIPVIMDSTHAVQLPGGSKGNSGGLREYVPYLARGAAAVGVDGFFFETHPSPDNALCDGPNMIDFKTFEKTVDEILKIDKIISKE